MEKNYHVPVLLDETLTALSVKPDGTYIDLTAGGGGHSFAIASRLTTGRLIAVDQDPDAIAEAGGRLKDLPVMTVQANFSEVAGIVDKLGITAVDGILMDIGVSSHQLDTASRGFSYHESMDAPLDMRMSQNGRTAADIIAEYDEASLADIFFKYGEEKFSRSIARAIVNYRQQSPIETTMQLSDLIKESVPAAYRRSGHPARKVFQALRIEVNGELERLSEGLDAAFGCLADGGRLAVITFHSLEDRMVKRRFAAFCTGCTCPPEFPICVCGKTPAGRLILRKPVLASERELEINPRSRSAKLRCVEKI